MGECSNSTSASKGLLSQPCYSEQQHSCDAVPGRGPSKQQGKGRQSHWTTYLPIQVFIAKNVAFEISFPKVTAYKILSHFDY